MKSTLSLVALTALAAVHFFTHVSAASIPTVPKAVYFMSNNPNGNSVHALRVMPNGTVGSGSVTATGGNGSRSPSNFGLTDAFNSQSAIAILNNYLFIINAGSDTLSMFKIDGNNPLKLTLVGAPINTVGNFPSTVAVSNKLKLACVANSGAKSGIACFSITPSGLKYTDGAFRPLSLFPSQTTPPKGPLNTVSQVFFSNDMTALYSTVKGTPMTDTANRGYLAYFPVQNGSVSTKGVFSSPQGTTALFGSVALPNRRILATDVTLGAVLLNVDEAGRASTVNSVAINGTACWAVRSPSSGLVYTTNDVDSRIAAFAPSTGALVAQTGDIFPGLPDIFETAAVGDMLYALSHGNATVPPHVLVMKVTGASGGVEPVQEFAPSGVGINVEGMAVYSA